MAPAMPFRAPATRWIALAAGGLAVGACGVALGGCGGSTARVTTHELRLRLEEFRFVPQNVSVPPGRLKIVAFNAGALTHNVVIEVSRRDVYGGRPIKATIPTILPGQSSAPIKVLLPPGRYLLLSNVANQADLGMTGMLTVRGS